MNQWFFKLIVHGKVLQKIYWYNEMQTNRKSFFGLVKKLP